MTKSICIFADISQKTGTGHFWRSVRFAKQLAQLGISVTVVTPENETSERAVKTFLDFESSRNTIFQSIRNLVRFDGSRKIRFKSIVPEATPNPEAGIFAPLADSIVAQLPAGHEIYIIDTYLVTAAQMRSLRERGKVIIAIDDFDHRRLQPGDVDLVINPSLPQSEMPYEGLTVLAPPDYCMLPRDLFVDAPTTKPDRVIITFGGTDSGHMALQLLDIMIQKAPELLDKDINFEVVVPVPEDKQNYHAQELIKKLGSRLKIVRRYKVEEFFPGAAMIVCAGGQTALEAQACGVPFVGLGTLNGTQTALGRYFEKFGVVVTDLAGMPEGKDAAPYLQRFADRLIPVLLAGSGVRLPRQNPNGFAKLVQAVCEMLESSPRRGFLGRLRRRLGTKDFS